MKKIERPDNHKGKKTDGVIDDRVGLCWSLINVEDFHKNHYSTCVIRTDESRR